MAQSVKRLPAMWETWVQSLVREDSLEEEMATHLGTFAWKHPWTESLVGYGTWGRRESDTTERLHLHFSLPPARSLPLVSFSVQHGSHFSEKNDRLTEVASLQFLAPTRQTSVQTCLGRSRNSSAGRGGRKGVESDGHLTDFSKPE